MALSEYGSACRRAVFHRLTYLERVSVYRRWSPVSIPGKQHIEDEGQVGEGRQTQVLTRNEMIFLKETREYWYMGTDASSSKKFVLL